MCDPNSPLLKLAVAVDGRKDQIELSGYLFDVYQFADKAHAGQTRSGGAPYITHPLAVCLKLMEFKIFDRATLAAALLHDVMEDCPQIPFGAIGKKFGEEISGIVFELTNLAKGRERHAAMLAHAQHYSDKATLIKIADRLCNIQDSLRPDSGWDLARTKNYTWQGLRLMTCMAPFPKDEGTALAKAAWDYMSDVVWEHVC